MSRRPGHFCIPHWSYRLADGLAPPLPTTLEPGRYRLTIYAWDWADNTTALDTTLTLTPRGWTPLGHLPASLFTLPGYFERNLLLPPPPPVTQAPASSPSGTASRALPLSPSYASPPTATGQQSPTTSSPPAAPTGGQAPTGPTAK